MNDGTHLGEDTTCEVEGSVCFEPIPTVSSWGAVVMALLIIAAGTVILRRRMDNLEQQPG